MSKSLHLLLAATFAAAPAIAAESNDWPGFRGTDGSGIARSGPGPAADLDLDRHLLWKAKIEGRGHSSPVISDGKVFLTTAIVGDVIPGAGPPEHSFGGQPFKHPQAVDGNRHHTMKVIALDADHGDLLWSHTAYAGRVYDDRHSASSYASPTPVTDGERVYAYFGSEGVYAYTVNGEPVWERDIGNIKTVGLGVGTSPVLHDGLLIILADEDSGDDSFIVALDATTGEEIWKRKRPVQASWATPVLVEHEGQEQLLTSGYEFVIAYDPEDGSELWRATGLQNNAIHIPMTVDDLAVFTSGYPGKVVFAIPLASRGDLIGSDEVRAWTYRKGTGYVPSNLLYDGLLYLTNDGGVITCLDARTGEVVYEGGRLPIRGRYSASMVGGGGRILMVNTDGDAALFRAGREHEVLGNFSVGESVWATPAIVGDRLYIRGSEHLFALGSASKEGATATGSRSDAP
ncbi:MAG: PQQ-like beta-propeller repeat protein [Holophagales bacterium]|nr:PQQ-like beta-propeller repeat protein [Holophagales bacterium]MYH24937.1 PQQ-like beta-propeller repeat protein [Holophagales bacterium]